MIPAGINLTKKLVAKIFVKPYNISRTGESCENKERASGILVMTSFSSERICFFQILSEFFCTRIAVSAAEQEEVWK